MERKLTPRQQGDLGELSAMEWLTSKGAAVFKPVFHSPDIDLVAGIDGRLLSVEVKTSRQERSTGHWGVMIATRGGNQSWNGTTKYFEQGRCDFLFVHVGDGRRWFIPTSSLDCGSGLTLGGPKYSEFEIEGGRPLAGPQLESAAAPGERRSWRDGLACKVSASVLSEFDSHLPHSASPSAATSRLQRSKYERKLGKTGHAVINQKRRITLPQSALSESGLRDGDYVHARADGSGRIVLEKAGIPVWAEPT
jgi:Holliday junction resolvase-like predicted endonuclease